MTVACYTALFGAYDSLKPHSAIPGVDFIAFTDDDNLTSRTDWQVKVRRSTVHPRLAAKEYKVLGPQLTTLLSYDYTIWIDASMEVTSPEFVEQALADIGHDRLALFRHSWNDCLYKEASDSVDLPKYIDQPVREQAEYYRSCGYPEHAGLWSSGCLARGRSRRLDDAMLAWMNEIERWTLQDQVSLPFVLWQHDIQPYVWPHPAPGNVNPWIMLHRHVDGS